MTAKSQMFDDDLLAEFTIEASEAFVEIESQLLELEAHFDCEKVDQLFRSVHSIKGAAAFMQLDAIAKLAHSLENMLSRLRSQELTLDRIGVEAMLQAADRLREMVQQPAQHAMEDVSAEISILGAWEASQTRPGASSPTEVATNTKTSNVSEAGTAADSSQAVVGTGTPVDSMEAVEQLVGELQEFSNSTPKRKAKTRKKTADPQQAEAQSPKCVPPYVTAPAVTQDAVKEATATLPPPADRPVAPAVAAKSADHSPTEATSVEPQRVMDDMSQLVTKPASKQTTDATIRVSVAVLEELVNLAGELVLSRNQLLRSIPEFRSKSLSNIGARIDQVTTSMQDVIMSARMQPVGLLFNRFPRLVRDLNGKLNKQCQLILEGTEVELDKTIIEALSDPLTHLIRNSLDHGIEGPQQRIAAGKSPEAKLTLSAYHEAGKVHIELVDDGQGIRADKILAKALEKQLVTPQQASRLSEREIVNLIFLPGFSTAEKVSDVSGRGVGMDVVRTNIERIGGTVDVSSSPGVGTTVHVALPLTLAIIPSWIVGDSGFRFALPEASIVEFIGLTPEEMDEKVEQINGSKVLRWRDSLLPLINLKDCLYGLKGEPNPGSCNKKKEDLQSILVVESGKHIYGLVVEQVCDPEQIVVKPIGRFLREGGYIEGAAVLGDGNMAFVLGLHGIAEKAMLTASTESKTGLQVEEALKPNEAQTALIVRTAQHRLAAVPRMVVQRIDRISIDDIQEVRGRFVLPIRGAQMPVVRVPWIDAEERANGSDVSYLLVFKLFDQEVGLMVPQIVDIREIPTSVDPRHANHDGVAGTVLVDDQVVEVLDVYELAENLLHLSECQQRLANKKFGEEAKRHTVLLAEDTPFFRNQIKRFLEQSEYAVLAANDGVEAWELLDSQPGAVDLLLTDIEMPRLNGYELAQKVRADERFDKLPIVAITSLHTDDALVKGHGVGIDDWKIKLHRDDLLGAVSLQIASKSRVRVSY